MHNTNINEESSNDVNLIILDTINQIITKIKKSEKETEIECVVEDVVESLLRRMQTVTDSFDRETTSAVIEDGLASVKSL